MPRRLLCHAGGIVFHVLNRSARRARLFSRPAEYQAFEATLGVALKRFDIRLLAYCVMPNHWHLVVWPRGTELPRFMHWLTLVHAREWHADHGTQGEGHVYQDRYRAIPVQNDVHLLTLIRYVERNPLRSNLVSRAEEWRWGSAWAGRDFCHPVPLSPWPVPRPDDWTDIVNVTHTGVELEQVQTAIRRDQPLGEPAWATAVAKQVGISSRGRGRPKQARSDLRFTNK